MGFVLKADQAQTAADEEEVVLAIGHSPAVYLKTNGLRSHTSRVRLGTAGFERIFILWIECQFDSKKSDE